MADEPRGPGSGPKNSGGGSGSGGGGGGGGSRNRNRNRNRSRGGGQGGSGGAAGGAQGGNRNQGQRQRPASGGGGAGGGGGGRGGGSGSGNRSGQNNRNRSGTPASGPRAAAAAPAVLTPHVVEPGLGATEVLGGEVAVNRRRAVLICIYAAVLPAVIVGGGLAVAAGVVVGIVGVVAVGLLIGFGLWRMAPAAALRRIGAVRLSEHDNPRLFNVTEGLCATFGLRMPAFFVVFDAVPNACALGRDAASADLVITSGLLEMMGPIELEGVIAHELAHVKRGDNGVSSIALTLGRLGGESMVRRCVGEAREYRADVVGASAVRYPRGLLDALRLMEAAPAPAGNSVFGPGRFGASRWVWIDPSVGYRDAAPENGDLDATSVRVAALSEW